MSHSDFKGIHVLVLEGYCKQCLPFLRSFKNAGCEVTVCDINGIVIFNGEAGDYVRVAVQPGIYMVKAGNRVLKAIVR